MPVAKKPAMAMGKLVPAFCAKKGGKIRLPAPKNMENTIKPTDKSSIFDKLCIKSTSIFYISKKELPKQLLIA